MIILTNVIFWFNNLSRNKNKSTRWVFQVTRCQKTDKRVNIDKTQYLFADNNVTLINLLTGVRRSTVYSKDLKDVKSFQRYSCLETSDENILEYSRNDDNKLFRKYQASSS